MCHSFPFPAKQIFLNKKSASLLFASHTAWQIYSTSNVYWFVLYFIHISVNIIYNHKHDSLSHQVAAFKSVNFEI